MLTVEHVSRILNQFNISFTESSVLSYLNRGLLQRSPRLKEGYYFRNTKYGYTIDQKSLEAFLREYGIIEEELKNVLP
jgi:hypothetical protein